VLLHWGVKKKKEQQMKNSYTYAEMFKIATANLPTFDYAPYLKQTTNIFSQTDVKNCREIAKRVAIIKLKLN
jgi:hypothetical protein